MQVLKFGGSSVSNATRISAMMDIVSETLKKDRVVLVSSAISGCTDYLLNNKDFSPLFERHNKIIDRLFTGEESYETKALISEYFDELNEAPEEERVTFGELFSTLIIASRFAAEGVDVEWLDSRDLIKVDDEGKVIEELTYLNIRSAVGEYPDSRLFVAPGFIASKFSNGNVTTLGRGGSDYSAALYAAALRANSLQIWTDVPGIMSANPKDISAAITIPYMSYNSAFTLADNGAKVLYAPTVKPAMQAGIDIQILNTFDPSNCGTVISKDRGIEQWCGVSALNFDDSSRICLVGENIGDRKSAIHRIEHCLSNNGIRAINPIYGEGSVFFIDVRYVIVKEALKAIHREFFEDSTPTTIDVYIAGNGAVAKALISLIDDSSDLIRQRTGKYIRIVGQSNSTSFVFGTTLDKIDLRNDCHPLRYARGRNDGEAIRNDEKLTYNDEELSLRRSGTTAAISDNELLRGDCHPLRYARGRNDEDTARNDGEAIRNDGEATYNDEELSLRRSGTTAAISGQESLGQDEFVTEICKRASRKSVFVDCTNDENLYLEYERLLNSGLNIVSSNRRSLSIPYTKYSALKNAAQENACFFRYDTTVGTSLPILESITSSANCSDEIESIEAVVSCTLNNIFTAYDGSESFANLLRKAQESGLSEKDPRIDLTGRDVLRKLIIIAREAGVALEEEDVKISPILRSEHFDCSLDEFYKTLEDNEAYFAKQALQLAQNGLRHRFVAVLKKTKSQGDCHADARNDENTTRNDGEAARNDEELSLRRNCEHECSVVGSRTAAISDQELTHFSAEIKMISVGPQSPFYWINGTENVIVINSRHCAPLVIKGAGEGAKQAAIGIIKDILL